MRISALNCIAIAFTLLLHLVAFLWIELPPNPWIEALHEENENRPLLVDIIKFLRPNSPPFPLPLRPAPAHPSRATEAGILNHLKSAARRSSTSVTQTTALDASPMEAPPSPQDVPYGNNRFNKALIDSQTNVIRLPGANDFVKVAGIHVQTPPSISQRLNGIGHWLRCKDAIFKSRMTDEELAKRGLSKQQMLLKFTEFGCH